MGKFKDIAHLEDLIFQCLEGIHQAKQMGNKSSYQLALATLELLNADYKEIAKIDFITQDRILSYHAGQWEIEWKK